MGYNCFIVRCRPLDADKNPDRNAQNEKDGKEKGRFDYDGFWKDLLDKFCYSLFKRALPKLYEDADLSVKPAFLDKEFTDILNTGDHAIRTAPHFVDSVLSVPLKNSEREPVIIHVEAQQGHGGGDMAERMNFYRCPIYFHFRREPVALAIIAGRRPKGEARYYSHDHYGTKILYEYNNLVLSELDDAELAASDNPIDIVLLAAKFAQRSRKEQQKSKFLRKAVELLDERGWSLDDKHDLLLFTERIVNLRDEELIMRYREDMEHRNREGKSMYIPLMLRDRADEIKRNGFEEGIEKGVEKAKLEDARNMLAKGIAPELVVEITGLPEERIQGLLN
jgi:predicted transposase/invertase (TIGR01784 family)